MEGFYWLAEGRLAGMDRPGRRGNELGTALASLTRKGIGAVVSLTEHSLSTPVLDEHGIHYLHLPIPDFHAPTWRQIDRFVEFVTHNLEADRAVAVHCHAGLGRTGTLLACYLVWEGLTAMEAMDRVAAKRPGSIETEEQRAAVRDYERRLHKRAARG